MASVTPFKSQFATNPLQQTQTTPRKLCILPIKQKKRFSVKAAVGDLSSDSTTYLIAGAAVVALVGTAFPIIFSRKDTYVFSILFFSSSAFLSFNFYLLVDSFTDWNSCPECDGAGFVRKSGSTLRANAARKDQAQIVCATCNGLGKLNQIDKWSL